MPFTDNVVQLRAPQQESQQEIIDDIGAQAFLFLRNAAEELDVSIKDVIVEHMAGLVLVMGAVEGVEETQAVLDAMSDRLHKR